MEIGEIFYALRSSESEGMLRARIPVFYMGVGGGYELPCTAG
jgi:hypothetical protein